MDVVVPLVAVVFPRDLPSAFLVSDAARRRRRNREHGVEAIVVDVGVVAVAE